MFSRLLGAENPHALVRCTGPAEVRADPAVLTGHVVVIGGGDVNQYAEWFTKRMNLPVAAQLRYSAVIGEPGLSAAFVMTGRDPWTGASREDPFEVGPVFDGSGATVRGARPRLLYDVALVARQPNPVNLDATATLCHGLHPLGTFGATRIFTDPLRAEDNERYRRERFGLADSFWMLVRVPCSHDIATTPDLRREYLRLLEWPGPDDVEVASEWASRSSGPF